MYSYHIIFIFFRGSDAVAPPGYVQTMVNKIVSNITINCCNLIVKYVEEDIVMSMNVKNLIFQSASDKWEPEFSGNLYTQHFQFIKIFCNNLMFYSKFV